MKINLKNTNWLLKLISVILAVFLWLVVININHPEVTKTVTVRNVVYENEQTVIDSGYTYSVDALDRGISVSVPVEKTDANKVKADDFQIVVDLASMGPYGAVQVNVQWLGSDEYKIDESEISWKTTTVNVTLEQVIERTYSVQTATTGEPADGYILGSDITVSPRNVTIKAPKSVLEQIHSVGIRADVEEASAEVTGEAALILYDVTGQELNLDYDSYEAYEFSISAESILYSIPLLKIKEVGIRCEAPSGTVAEGYRYTGIQGLNQTVHIAGLKAVLAEVGAIVIPSEVLDLEGADRDVEVTLKISDYVPEGVTVESEDEITITLLVEPLVQETWTVAVDQIAIEDAQEEYHYALSGATEIEIIIEGLQEDLGRLTEEMITAYVSVDGLTVGEHTVPVQIELDNGYTLVESGEVTVTVTRDTTGN